MRYENLEPLCIAQYMEQRGYDENLVGQFRSGINRVTIIMFDFETGMVEIESSRDQSDAKREALAQGLTDKTVRQLEQEKSRLGVYEQHLAGVALLSENKARRTQMEVQQVREAHEEAVDAALDMVRPQEDPLVQAAQ